MRSVLFRATIEGIEIVPYVRMTQASKWSRQSKRYLDSQKALAWELKKFWNGNGAIDYPVEISYAVHRRSRQVCDNSNILKAIEDALQYAGIVSNDRFIEATGKTRTFRDGKARVVVELRRLLE